MLVHARLTEHLALHMQVLAGFKALEDLTGRSANHVVSANRRSTQLGLLLQGRCRSVSGRLTIIVLKERVMRLNLHIVNRLEHHLAFAASILALFE